MFHHYSENSSSTGEPPTLPSDDHSISLISEQIVPTDTMSQEETIQMSLQNNRESSRSISGQEPDSGYEASPSSLVDNPGSFHFFSEQSMIVSNQISHPHSSRQYSDEELEFLNSQSPFLYSSESESDVEDRNRCPDCNSSTNCDCDRTDSSTTYVTTAISNCDNNSSSRSNSSDLSSNRPSSEPIEIPVSRCCRMRPDVIIDPRIDLRLQPARSQPIDFNRILTFDFTSHSHGVSSWPSTITPWRIQRNIALPFFLETLSSRFSIPRTDRLRRSNRRVRSRRQIIDSDASSVCSSDDDGPEDVFNMAGEEPSSFSPVLANSVPLPDVVVLQSDTTRRSRSVSVNLPPDPVLLQNIGQTLRRFSDQFQQRREIVMAARCTRRRQTIGSISYLHDDHS